MKELKFFCSLLWVVSSMRLDLDDLSSPAVNDESTVQEAGHGPSLKIRTGNDQCTMMIDSDEKSKHDAHFITSGDQKRLPYCNPSKNPDYDKTGVDIHHWYDSFMVNMEYRSQNPYRLQGGEIPIWDRDDVKFRLRIEQIASNSHIDTEFYGVPANRGYMIFLGTVEKDSSDHDQPLTKAMEACSKGAKIEYKYIIDIWKTGDDHTKWPKTNLAMGDAEAISNIRSRVYARRGKWIFQGKLLEEMGKKKMQKAYWIVDITYIDYQDFIMGDFQPEFKKKLHLTKKGSMHPRTFWGALGKDKFESLSDQKKVFRTKAKEGGIWLVTHLPSLTAALPYRFEYWRESLRYYRKWEEFANETTDNAYDQMRREGTKHNNWRRHEVEDLPYYNGPEPERPTTAPSFWKDTYLLTRDYIETDLSQDSFKELKRVGEHTLIEEYVWDDDKKPTGKMFPVVACGIFSKVWKVKSCSPKKNEGEGS